MVALLAIGAQRGAQKMIDVAEAASTPPYKILPPIWEELIALMVTAKDSL